MNINKNLAQFFSVPENKNSTTENNNNGGGTFNSSNFQKDYELVQDNLKQLIGSGNVALESALKVATESDSPRAFEVVAILLKTMADLNNNVLDVHKKAKDTTNSKVEIKQTYNSVFVGSTKELQNLLGIGEETVFAILARIILVVKDFHGN
jgi:hypothetical protein